MRYFSRILVYIVSIWCLSCADDRDRSVVIDFTIDNLAENENTSRPITSSGTTTSTGTTSSSTTDTTTDDTTTGVPSVSAIGLPALLKGTVPEETSIRVYAEHLPTDGYITIQMDVYDADDHEGIFYINDQYSIPLFGDAASDDHSRVTVPLNYTIPVSWLHNGENIFRFTHTATSGYIIESMTFLL